MREKAMRHAAAAALCVAIGPAIAAEPAASPPVVISVHDPRPLSWDSMVIKGETGTTAKSLEIRARRGAQALDSLQLLLGNGARYSIPAALLQAIDGFELRLLADTAERYVSSPLCMPVTPAPRERDRCNRAAAATRAHRNSP